MIVKRGAERGKRRRCNGEHDTKGDMEGWKDPAYSDRWLEKKKERVTGISMHLKGTGEQQAEVGKWAMRQL